MERQLTEVHQLEVKSQSARDAGAAITPLFNYISGVWSSFGVKRSPDEMRQMQIAWYHGLNGLTAKECIAAIDRKVKKGQIYPPGSPAELRAWVEETKLYSMPEAVVEKQAQEILEEYPIYGDGSSLGDFVHFMLVGICSMYKWDIPSSVAAVIAEIERRQHNQDVL